MAKSALLGFACAKHSQTTTSTHIPLKEEIVMKRFLMIAGLLITISNIGAGIAYACSCFENGQKACETTGNRYLLPRRGRTLSLRG